MASRPLYIPHLEIEVARTLRYRGHSWHDLHHDLKKEGLRMPLLSEFMTLLKTEELSLDDGTLLTPPRRKVIQRNFLGREYATYGALLDAQFFHKEERWYLRQGHHLGSNGIDLQFAEEHPLEDLLLSTGVIDLDHISSLGIPQNTAKKGGISYRPPQDRCVACYSVKQGKASLLFDYDPNTLDFLVGVYPARDRRSAVA